MPKVMKEVEFFLSFNLNQTDYSTNRTHCERKNTQFFVTFYAVWRWYVVLRLPQNHVEASCFNPSKSNL